MFDNHTILLFWMLCSFDRDVLIMQRIMGFFILITHKSMKSEIWSCGI